MRAGLRPGDRDFISVGRHTVSTRPHNGPHIGLATCADLPDWERDDEPLFEALRSRDATIAHPVWDDPDVDWSVFDAVLIRTTWDYMDRPDAYLAWVDTVAAATILLNPPDVIRWNLHKTYLRDLAARGVPVAPTVWIDAGEQLDLAAVMRDRGWSRGFLKPVVGATARETCRFDAEPDDLVRAQQHLDRVTAVEAMMLQPYLARVETEGEISAIFIDGSLTHSVLKMPVAGDYRTQEDFGAIDTVHEMTPEDRQAAETIVAAVGMDLLYARVDFLRTDDGHLCVTELELIEPSLFFRHGPTAADRLADALLGRLH